MSVLEDKCILLPRFLRWKIPHKGSVQICCSHKKDRRLKYLKYLSIGKEHASIQCHVSLRTHAAKTETWKVDYRPLKPALCFTDEKTDRTGMIASRVPRWTRTLASCRGASRLSIIMPPPKKKNRLSSSSNWVRC